jgi:hypothetical protein
VIAKAKKGNDLKWCQLHFSVEAAGEVWVPLRPSLKIKAFHMDVEGGADSGISAISASFPLEDLVDFFMPRRSYLTAIEH